MNWITNDAGKLEREFTFENFSDAVVFVNRVAELAEEKEHHPDIFIHDYKHVTITLFTHDKNEITEKDKKMAELIDELDRSYVQNRQN
jgi:4a-hydroxytetrahydrobiopterin dehydratase